jgi:dsRNA-specific ribonuclease
MYSETQEEPIVYLGLRDESFRDLIRGLLERGKLKAKYIDLLTTDESMKVYGQAFTAASANPEENYEIFEQLGDVSANKFIVWYSYRRFPQLECPQGVKVVARLRINYGARQSFSDIGERLGFWPYISASEDDRLRKKKDKLEDCVESFIGCTEYLLDKAFRPGVGYAIVYDILSSIFDEIPMSLRYEDLYDAKTRLKELFDLYKSKLGSWAFVNNRDDMLAISQVYMIPPNSRNKQVIKRKVGGTDKDMVVEEAHSDWQFMGEGKAAKKADAEQKAAEAGLKLLNENGWVKEIPEEYKFFCE